MDLLQEKHIHTSRGFHYRYYVSPTSSSPYTLLPCHGFPDSASLYQFIVPTLLKTGLKLIIPDLLGYGGTSKPTDPAQYEWSLMSRDLVEVLAAESVSSNIIPLGHDWGAAMVQCFYMLHKPLCAGLINLNVALMPPRSEPFNLDAANAHTEKTLGYPIFAYWNLFLPEEGVKLIESQLESMWYVLHGDADDWMEKMWCTHGGMKEFLEQDRRDVPLKRLPDGDRLMREWIAEKKAGGLMAPTCWYRAVAGGHQDEMDRKLSEKGAALVEHPCLFVGCSGDLVCRVDAIEGPKRDGLVPDCTVRVVESGHWCLYEKPEEVGSVVVEWLVKKGYC
ncbi:uncharacterized protein LTR77_004978 [Saxophila tyrrhenica]|uniref:AB hydrolase-1 domain-containing protein n=1 Tax=Saxophila tyrrhenica TaxID=1690608 RepID=A0AAV9PAR5_9PEZI|nr:hypothetical protein LTR77_004978 [Saxophila tyrrhenica]